MSLLNKLLGRDDVEATREDLVGERRTSEQKNKQDGKGPVPPIRRETFSGFSIFYEVARKDTEAKKLRLVEEYEAQLATELGDDPVADIDDVIETRMESGKLKLVAKYLDCAGDPVYDVEVPEALAEAILADYVRQNEEADAEYEAALAEYKAKKSGKPASKDNAPAKEVPFELTQEILDLMSTLSREDKLDYIDRTPGITPLDRAKIMAAKPKPAPAAEPVNSEPVDEPA